MTVPFRARGVTNESFFVTYRIISSGERSDGSKVTVLHRFAFSFMQALGSQMFQLYTYSAGRFMVVAELGDAFRRSLSSAASSVLSCNSVFTTND